MGQARTFAAIERLLVETADFFADPMVPAGCMVATGILYCGPEHDEVSRFVAGLRAVVIDAVAERLAEGQRRGELPGDADIRAMARFYGAVIQGMSVQARDGAGRDDLRAMAQMALSAWPGPHG